MRLKPPEERCDLSRYGESISVSKQERSAAGVTAALPRAPPSTLALVKMLSCRCRRRIHSCALVDLTWGERVNSLT